MSGFESLNGSCLYALDTKLYPTVLDHPDFKYFCELIGEIKSSRADAAHIGSCLHSMKYVLKRFFGADFELTIVDNDLSTNLFVCNVFPPYAVCKEIADLIIEEDCNEISTIRRVWSNTDLWHVDLDSRLFFDQSALFNAGEIAALIIANIERIAFSYDVVVRTNYIVNQMFATRSYTMNKLARSHVCRNLFVLPFFNACMFKTYAVEKTKLPDGTCISGYLKEIYDNAVRKIMCYGSNEEIDAPIAELDAVIQGTCDWIFACITDLKYSTRLLKETLRKILLSQKSYYVKNTIIDILTAFGDYSKDDVIAAESTNPVAARNLELNPHAVEFRQRQYEAKAQKEIDKAVAVAEGSFFDLLDNLGYMKKVSQRDVDMLRVDVQKITSADDKLFVLDNLHDKLDIVETSLALLQDKDKAKKVKMSKSSLLDIRKQLDDLRDLVLKHEIKAQTYSVFVKYPEGYQG